MKFYSVFILALFILQNKVEAIEYKISGQLENRLINYTQNTSSNLGYLNFFQFEQKSKISSEILFFNQMRAKATSFNQDVNEFQIKKNSNFQTYLGENYFRYQSGNSNLQIGYQEIVWGEAFGFNYADIINPKDNRFTHYNDQGISRLPIFLLNYKYFFENSSLQLIYGPRPEFSKTIPLHLFLPKSLSNFNIITESESKPQFFKESEYGLKYSTSFSGIDMSLSYFDYLDRNPFYKIKNLTGSNLTLTENHRRTKSTTFSFAKTLFDYVIRMDFVYSTSKTFNTLNGTSLNDYQSNTKDILLGFDTPSFDNYTLFFIWAHKSLDKIVANSLSPNQSDAVVIKLNKTLEAEKSLELSYTREIKEKANGIQALINFPVNNNTELKLGSEFYFGPDSSQYNKLKKINSVFIDIKNYFQI